MKARRGAVTIGEIGMMLLLVAVIVFLVIRHGRQKADRAREEEARIAAAAKAEAERVECEKTEAARLAEQARLEAERKAEEDRRRQAALRAEQERLEQEKREAEIVDQAGKTLEGDLELASLPLDKSFWIARYRVLKLRYKDADVGYIADAGAEDNPSKVSKRTIFWYVDESFANDGTIYEIEVLPGSVQTVYALRENDYEKVIDASSFAKKMYAGVGVLMRGGKAWICGTGKRVRTIRVPARGIPLSPQSIELKSIDSLLHALQCQSPQGVKYKVSLQDASGNAVAALGIVDSNGELAEGKIDDAIRKDLLRKEKERKGSASAKRPRLKTFRQTVIKYDGVHIKKDSKGVTWVPRTFQHLGTSANNTKKQKTVDDFRRQWESLIDEAERQEKRAEEIKKENARLMEQYNEELLKASDATLSEREIDQNRSSYTLLIERQKE